MKLALRSATWLILAGWFGGMGLFAFMVAPTAFSLLSSSDAGALVAPILRGLNYYGMVAGSTLALVAHFRGRGLLGVALPLILALLCAFSEFAVSSAIGGVLPSDLSADSQTDAAQRFSTLHHLSRLLFIVTWIGTIALILIQVRADSATASPEVGN